MDCLQDLAINSLTVLDQSCDSSFLCMGDATFVKSIKINNNIHLLNDIRTCGNIIPLRNTSSIGTKDNIWMDIYATDGHFNSINVDELNVKNLNGLQYTHKNEHNYLDIKEELKTYINSTFCLQDKHQMRVPNSNKKLYKYIEIKQLDCINDSNISLNIDYDSQNSAIVVNIIISECTNYLILDLSHINLQNKYNEMIEDYTDSSSINNIMCINNDNVSIKIDLPIKGNKIKLIILNPENYNIKFDKKIINSVNSSNEQIYKFIFINELNKWLITYKN
jgi:hypothetical protein